MFLTNSFYKKWSILIKKRIKKPFLPVSAVAKELLSFVALISKSQSNLCFYGFSRGILNNYKIGFIAVPYTNMVNKISLLVANMILFEQWTSQLKLKTKATPPLNPANVKTI